MKRPATPLRVLLVEDSEHDALLLLRELRRGGYEPVCERVSTPEEMERALEGASEKKRPWQIVISDYYMPRFGAPDALALLRKLGYDTPFVLVSGKIGEDAAVAILRAGAQDYVSKENMVRLCPAIERELREAEGRRERERAEKALRESEERYRVVAETASEAIVVIDEESRMLFINAAAEKMFGYARAEMIGQRLTMLMPERLREVHEASLERYLKSGRRRLDWSSIQLPGLHESGEEIPLEISVGEFVRDGERFFTGFVRDITERREAEKRLRETETRYRTLVEQIPAVTYIQKPLESSDPKAVTYVSPQYETMLGYPRESEVLDEEHWLRTLHPEDRERVLAEEVRTDETGEPFRVEYRVIAGDGRVVWVRDQATLVRDEEGRPLYWLGVQHDITDQKQAEQELRESEERFRATFEQAAVGVAHVSLEGRWLRVNQKLCEIVGYSAEELLRMTFQDITHRDDLETDLSQGRRLLAGEIVTYSMEKRYLKKDGSIVWINLTVSLVRDPNGDPKYFIGVIEDISERKQAQEALRQSEERYRAVVKQSIEGLYLVDGDTTRILETNPALQNMLGYTADELRGTELHEIVAHDRKSVEADIERTLKEGKRFIRERRYRRKDGSVVEVEVAASTICYGGKRVICAAIRDITERRRADEERSRLAAIVESSDGAILGKTLDGTITSWNRAAERLYGYSVDEAVGRSVSILVPPDRAEEVPEILRKVGRGDKVERLETVRVTRDGRRLDVSLTVSPIRNPEGDIVGASTIARDITERKRAEAALREAREAERNRIARDLHDDILQDIVYALQEIQIVQVISEDGGTSGLEEAAEALRRSVEGLRGAIFDLRLRETLGRSFISSLEGLLDLNRRMARRSYELELIVEDGFPRALSERAGRELARIVQEALANVRRHAEARHARVRLWREGDLARVEVADDGRGFDAESPGVGVGQQSMRHRALELGGELEVESQPGRGTRVRFEAPVSRLVEG